MGSSNLGSQKVTLVYKQPATTENVNSYLRSIIKPGIYKGLTLTQTTGNGFTISAGKIWQDAAGLTDRLGVSIEFQSAITGLTLLPTAPIVYLTYSWSNVASNYADVNMGTSTDVSNATALGLHPIIIGSGVFSSLNLIGFDYSLRTRGLLDADSSYMLQTDQNPTQNYHVGNRQYNDGRYLGLAAIGATRGAIPEYGASGWTSIAPGTNKYVLKSNGPGADPSYQLQAAADVSLAAIAGMVSTDVQAGISEVNSKTTSTKMSNTKVTVSGNTVTFDAATGTIGTGNPIRIAVPSTTAGQLVERTIISTISLTLPSSTINTRVCGINTTDGSATYATAGVPTNTTAAGIEWFLYYIYDSVGNQDLIGISKSPLHTVVPSAYFYGSTATTITDAGAGSGSTSWDAMITSAGAAITAASAYCICLGPAITATVSGGSTNAGWFSSVAIQSGYVPTWGDKKPKVRSTIECAFTPPNLVGYGTTDTVIRKISSPTVTGTYIQYFSAGGTVAAGGIGGAEFYCTVSGYYSFNRSDIYTVANTLGFSVNSSQRTTSIVSINSGNVLDMSSSAGANFAAKSDVTPKFFTGGSIIRGHDQGGGAPYVGGTSTFFAAFHGFELT